MSIPITYFLLMLFSSCCCVPAGLTGNFFVIAPVSNSYMDGYAAMALIMGVATIVHLSAAARFLRAATRNLEAQRGDDGKLLEDHKPPEDLLGRPMKDWPPVTDNALLWKERYTNRSPWVEYVLPFALLIVVFYTACLVVITAISDPARYMESVRVLSFYVIICAGIYLMLTAWRLIGCVVREREQGTLDGLLTLPIERSEVLKAKLIAGLMVGRYWLLPFAVALIGPMFLGEQYVAAGLIMLLVFVVHLAFVTGLAMFITVVCQSRMSAYISMALALSAVLGGTLLLPQRVGIGETLNPLTDLNPIVCWNSIFKAPSTSDASSVGPSIFAYSLAAAVLWSAAFRRFNKN